MKKISIIISILCFVLLLVQSATFAQGASSMPTKERELGILLVRVQIADDLVLQDSQEVSMWLSSSLDGVRTFSKADVLAGSVKRFKLQHNKTYQLFSQIRNGNGAAFTVQGTDQSYVRFATISIGKGAYESSFKIQIDETPFAFEKSSEISVSGSVGKNQELYNLELSTDGLNSIQFDPQISEYHLDLPDRLNLPQASQGLATILRWTPKATSSSTFNTILEIKSKALYTDGHGGLSNHGNDNRLSYPGKNNSAYTLHTIKYLDHNNTVQEKDIRINLYRPAYMGMRIDTSTPVDTLNHWDATVVRDVATGAAEVDFPVHLNAKYVDVSLSKTKYGKFTKLFVRPGTSSYEALANGVMRFPIDPIDKVSRVTLYGEVAGTTKPLEIKLNLVKQGAFLRYRQANDSTPDQPIVLFQDPNNPYQNPKALVKLYYQEYDASQELQKSVLLETRVVDFIPENRKDGLYPHYWIANIKGFNGSSRNPKKPNALKFIIVDGDVSIDTETFGGINYQREEEGIGNIRY